MKEILLTGIVPIKNIQEVNDSYKPYISEAMKKLAASMAEEFMANNPDYKDSVNIIDKPGI